MARQEVSPRITRRLTPRQLKKNAEALSASLARNELNVTRVATECQTLPRAVRRWIRIATDRGVDVLELAREKLREQGVDPGRLLAEKVREGMGPRAAVSDRSDTVLKGRPKKKVSEDKSTQARGKVP